MLTFESASVLGVSSIVEKLSVRNLPPPPPPSRLLGALCRD